MRIVKIPALVVFSLLFAFSSSADTTVNAAKVRVLFTPGDNVAASITQAIRNAKQSVHVQAFNFTNKAIARALQDASQRSIDVKVWRTGNNSKRAQVFCCAI